MTTFPALDNDALSQRAQKYRADGLWGHRSLVDGIEAAADRRPGALAVADNDRLLTYGELRWAVAAGVARLSSSGLCAGDCAVLVAGNTVEGVVAYQSLLRIGATAVVLDQRCGAADVRYAVELLSSVPIRAIVPSAERTRLAGNFPVEVIPLESFGEVDAAAAAGAHWPEGERDTPAVVLFTSGTTGRPKAAIHSLNTLTAGADNMARITGASEESILFLVSPISSITGIMQMQLAADRHAALILENHFDPEGTLDRMNSSGATLLGGAPFITEQLLRAADRRGVDRVALRTLALGGAMLPRALLEQVTDRFGIEIARVYGSTEAPNFTGSTPEDERERRLSDDGALMPGSEVRVGSANHPQEGMVRGPGVFLGYADPDDNAAAIEDGWFRTGDLVEVVGGRLTVIGRLKEEVNRKGLKIPLSEIEEALTGLPSSVEHACFGVADPFTGERLAVAVRPESGATITLDDVVDHLIALGIARRRLPEQLVVWDGPMPRTTSGKVVRSRLAMESAAKPSELARHRRI